MHIDVNSRIGLPTGSLRVLQALILLQHYSKIDCSILGGWSARGQLRESRPAVRSTNEPASIAPQARRRQHNGKATHWCILGTRPESLGAAHAFFVHSTTTTIIVASTDLASGCHLSTDIPSCGPPLPARRTAHTPQCREGRLCNKVLGLSTEPLLAK